jgi:uncharacterized membrane protein YjjP (DUF1212 family)
MAEAAAPRLDAAGHVLLRLARLYLSAGADSEHVRNQVEVIARRWGLAVQLFMGSERLLLMVGADDVYRTRIGHAVGAMGIDAGRLAALEAVAADMVAGRLDATAADVQLQAIETRPAVYPTWLVVLAVAATAASLARLFGASWPVVAAAFWAGLISLLLRRWLGGLGLLPAAVAALTAAISGAAAALPLHLLRLDPTLALISAGMILVPGVPLINGVRDLVRGHPSIGMARLANGAVVVIAIACGLAVASLALGLRLPVALRTPSLALPWDVAFAGLAALGFAILFNAPRRAIAAIVLCGALSHGVRTGAMDLGADIVIATLGGAFVAASLAIALGRGLRMPWIAFAFPGVVAMVPGSYAFRAMIGALELTQAGPDASAALIGATLAALISTGLLTAAIGIGLLVATGLQPTTPNPDVR